MAKDSSPKRFGRRASDRLKAGTQTLPSDFVQDSALNNHVLMADDDFQQTAEALESIQSFLVRALTILESETPNREELRSLALDEAIAEDAAFLGETVEDLRRRLYDISVTMDRKHPV